MQQIILASISQSRQYALSLLNVPFIILAANIDEKAIRDEDLSIRAAKIARAKAEYVLANHDGIIIAGDTFVVCENAILEKPKDTEEAKKMIQHLSGRKAHVYTGFCYLDRQHHLDTARAVIVKCLFRTFTQDEIEKYVTYFPATTWAGGFSTATPYGSTVAAEIHGSYTGFTYGLPLEILIPLLRESGYAISPREDKQ